MVLLFKLVAPAIKIGHPNLYCCLYIPLLSSILKRYWIKTNSLVRHHFPYFHTLFFFHTLLHNQTQSHAFQITILDVTLLIPWIIFSVRPNQYFVCVWLINAEYSIFSLFSQYCPTIFPPISHYDPIIVPKKTRSASNCVGRQGSKTSSSSRRQGKTSDLETAEGETHKLTILYPKSIMCRIFLTCIIHILCNFEHIYIHTCLICILYIICSLCKYTHV